MANSVVFPRAQFFSNSGRPLVGGRIHTYVAGSSTRARTYQDAANVQINTNPIILDARGEAAIYLAEGVEYKFVVEDSTGALIMTQEPVYGAIWPNASEWPSDATLSYQYMTEARAAASASGPIAFFGTYAAAQAAVGGLPDGGIVEVSQDETRAGARTRYKVQAGALVFVANLDQVRLDLAAAAGAALVGFKQAGTGAVSTTVQAKLRESVSILDFAGADRTGATSSQAALDAARAAVAANPTRYRLVFPSGIYSYSVSPNWAIQDAVIEAEGEVRLRYTGVGNAVILDAGGASTDHVYNMRMGHFIVEAPSSALNGVYARGVHHSHLGFNVRGAGGASAGMEIRFCVCTTFERPTVSVNEAGWYLGAAPAYGLHLLQRNAGETVSYCSFINPIIEGPNIGIQLIQTLGNTFLSGTSEGCATYGVFAAAGANHDKFIGTDFEINTGADAYIQGTGIVFDHCESTNTITFGSTARRGGVYGGEHKSVLFDAGSAGCKAIGLTYNRENNGGTFVDAGTKSTVVSVKSAVSNDAYLAGSVAYAGVAGIPADGNTSTTLAVPGAAVGDPVTVSLNPMTAGFMANAYVSAAEVVTVLFLNKTGGIANLAAGTLRAIAHRP